MDSHTDVVEGTAAGEESQTHVSNKDSNNSETFLDAEGAKAAPDDNGSTIEHNVAESSQSNNQSAFVDQSVLKMENNQSDQSEQPSPSNNGTFGSYVMTSTSTPESADDTLSKTDTLAGAAKKESTEPFPSAVKSANVNSLSHGSLKSQSDNGDTTSAAPISAPDSKSVSATGSTQDIPEPFRTTSTPSANNVSEPPNNPSNVNVPTITLASIPTPIDLPATVGADATIKSLKTSIASPSTHIKPACNTPITPKSEKRPKTKRRGSAWTDDQTEFLLEVWALYTDYKSSEEFAPNASIYRLVSKALCEKGVDKTWEQCKTRIHTLKRAYKQTKEEINAGATSIVYCRHFEKLEIIMEDNPNVTPKMLAESLAEKRVKNAAHAQAIQNAQKTIKRKQQTPEKGGKKTNTGQNTPTSPQPPPSPLSPIPNSDQSNLSSPTNYWQGQQQHQQQFATPPPPVYQNQNLPNTYHSTDHFSSPPYNNSGHIPSDQSHDLHGKQIEINNNDMYISMKHEPVDNQYNQQQYQHYAPVSTSPACKPYAVTPSVQRHHQSKEDLEKMRLDLEIRKIDMEKNKLEMEERQRREEREHQYRMMQLLLVGLGQQNTATFLAGQGAEQDVAHAQRNTNLSRAIENGLVPGGSLMLNEKGLSFNEI